MSTLLEDQTNFAPDPWYRLQDAIEERKLAENSTEFVRAYAREKTLRRQLEEREVSTKERSRLEKKGHAMPGGRYPIRHAGDVAAAVKAFGRGNPPDKEAIRQHIIKRAKALGVHETHIPDSWKKGSSS